MRRMSCRRRSKMAMPLRNPYATSVPFGGGREDRRGGVLGRWGFLMLISPRQMRALARAPARSGNSGVHQLERADEVELADVHAALAQQVVGGGDMEEEVRDLAGEQVLVGVQRLALREGDLDHGLGVDLLEIGRGKS